VSFRLWYALIFGAPILGLSLILEVFWRPEIDENFLFLYFGIATALGVAVWSTLVLADKRDKVNFVLVLTVLFDIASISALAGAVFGPSRADPFLSLSVSSLTVGMITLFLHTINYPSMKST